MDYGFGYDPEVPAGFQDADLEMAEFEQAAADRTDAIMARKYGSTAMKCNECDKQFKKRIAAGTFEVKCPKCGGYDTEIL